jgi:hypothetical protein
VPEDVPTDLPNPSVRLTTNGVGPWKGLLPTEPFYDPVLLENGDSRNVVDRYRYWLLEAIVADLTSRGIRSTWRSRTGSTT